MLAIARQAKASNETLYRWYGDKRGLFARMIERNAAEVEAHLDAALEGGVEDLQALRDLAPWLLTLLTGDKAISLNRAAAADASGELGGVLAAIGRNRLGPRIASLIDRAAASGAITVDRGTDAVGLYMDLVVGD